jgi:hypothetical protein
MVKYSERAIRALGFLKRPYNDIDIYVEDRTCHHMYVLLFRRILPEHIHLTSVNQAGDRNSVIGACRRDQANDGRMKLYLIDGDFDHYKGRRRPRLKYLYRLRGYCVENILIKEAAAVAVGAEADTNSSEHDIRRRLDFQVWIKEIIRKLRSLFIVYSAAEALGVGVGTVSFNVNRLCERQGREQVLSDKKIMSRMFEVSRAIRRSCGLTRYKEELRRIRGNLESMRISADLLISGKNYLLHCSRDESPDYLVIMAVTTNSELCWPLIMIRIRSHGFEGVCWTLGGWQEDRPASRRAIGGSWVI